MFGKQEKDGGAHYPGLAAPNAGRRIAIWIYSLAALLIVLSTASLTFIAHMAWREADRRALEGEQLRMDNTLRDIHRQIARDQLALAQWDKTFRAVQSPIDKIFIEEELIDDLWEDFGLDRTFVVGRDGILIAQAMENETRYGPRQLPPGHLVRDLADKTRSAFDARKSTSSSVFADWYMPQSVLLDISSSAFAVLDGTHAFLSAMPILPDDGHVELNADYPLILVNAVYFDEDWMAELDEQLSFKDLRFHPGAPEQESPTNHLIRTAEGTVFGYFRWDHAKPGRDIWLTALPLVLLLASIIAVVAFTAANKISRLSASLEESERKNHHFARHDALTGLPNRHHFSDCLDFAVDALPDKPFAILACDLDRFKPVNDTYGHEAGDRVICAVADRLKDVVGQKGVVSRIGGDEFIILLTRIPDRTGLGTLADQVLKSVAGPIEIGNGRLVEIGISVGISIAPDCGDTDKDLIRMADEALYRAKERGRNTYEFAPATGSENEQLALLSGKQARS